MAEIKGLTLFRDRFAAHRDKYILIGGCALQTVLGQEGLAVRATKDLDIVLVVEAVDAAFVAEFWKFVQEGGYTLQQVGGGERRNFYRFKKPTHPDFPSMLELFSRTPDLVSPLADGSRITPVPVDEEVESLSAILLDDAYYDYILAARREHLGLPYIGEECLIPLKALAWLDLRQRRKAGEDVDSKDVNKHLKDVLALSQLLTEQSRFEASPRILADMERFAYEALADDSGHARNDNRPTIEAVIQRVRAAFVPMA